MIYTMLLGANMINTALAVSQVPADIASWVGGLDVHPLLIIVGFLAAFVILTSVLDQLAIMLLPLPILLPTILGLEIAGLTAEQKASWFGILMLMVVEIGLIAPPIGLNVYVVAKIAKSVPIGEIYRGIMPFLVSDVVRVALLVLVPAVSLWAVKLLK